MESRANRTTALGWENDWPAPAKINLFLHVVGRRSDGYHLLQTVFRFLDAGDALQFSPREDGKVVQAQPVTGLPPDDDLSIRAALLLQQACSTNRGVTIALKKRLPIGGGLGGGSSDAATTLLALNQLWGCGLSRTALAGIGLTLGADVPVFIFGRSAFGEGVGEKLVPVSPPPAWYLVLTPPVAVSTAEIFSAPELKRNTPTIPASEWHAGFGKNNLEAITCKRYPEVARHLEWLRGLTDVRQAAMSGSGSCCFAEFPTGPEAQAALRQLPSDMSGFVAQGLDLHPLFALT